MLFSTLWIHLQVPWVTEWLPWGPSASPDCQSWPAAGISTPPGRQSAWGIWTSSNSVRVGINVNYCEIRMQSVGQCVYINLTSKGTHFINLKTWWLSLYYCLTTLPDYMKNIIIIYLFDTNIYRSFILAEKIKFTIFTNEAFQTVLPSTVCIINHLNSG